MKSGSTALQITYGRLLDLFICLPFLIIPVLVTLPYRVNIFLSWEGAYRMYLGQVPYQDFGLPMGFGYWIIPTIFFKLLGPSFMSLIHAQVFINLVSLLSLRGILYALKVKPYTVSLALLTFCLTYVVFNFWPWYNHSVIVYELLALYLLIWHLTSESRISKIGLPLSGMFTFLSFFTKQDGGAICFMICVGLLVYHFILTKKYLPLIVYLLAFFVVAAAFILPFLQHDFLYWFNYGQPPHNSRIGIGLLIDTLFNGEAIWEKIYLALIIVFVLMLSKKAFKTILNEPDKMMLSIIGIGLIGQALITRVSSPLPTDHMTFFHGTAIALLLTLSATGQVMDKWKNATVLAVVITLLFSTGYWKYMKGVFGNSLKEKNSTVAIRPERWMESPLKSFAGVTMPRETVEGLQKIMEMPVTKKEQLSVLNMSELTPLALELGFTPPVNQPLWYHLNIGIFQKEVDELCQRVKNGEYDLVLFQDIPGLVHFYPYQVQDTLKAYYQLDQSFLAPRKLENSMIEVWIRK